MKIMITGANGQLGRDLPGALEGLGTIASFDLPDFDLTQPANVRAVVEALQPDVIINCAAYTRVDDAERNQELCHRVNAEGPWVLAETARKHNALLVHLSTDYVFDGRKPPPGAYVETDSTHPLNWYGRTKLAGEQAVQETASRHIILRTAWLFGRTGANFPKAILRRMLREPTRPIWVVNDQYGTPTWTWKLALQIRALIEGGGQGLYHATAEGYATWYLFATHLLHCMRIAHLIEPCRTTDYPTPAARPANSILENARLKAEGLNRMTDWHADVEEFAAMHGSAILAELRLEAAS